MRLRGHKYAVGTGPGDNDADVQQDEKDEQDLEKQDDETSLLPRPKKLNRDEAVQWVRKVLERSRGFELPGSFNPILISQLFWEQSRPWEEIALAHVNTVARKCKEFVNVVLQETAPPEFQSRLASLSVDAALREALEKCKVELRQIIKDKSRHPMTYNHYFTTTLQKMRQRKQQKINEKAQEEANGGRVIDRHGDTYDTLNTTELLKALNDSIELDMDRFSAQEALDYQRAYYKASNHGQTFTKFYC